MKQILADMHETDRFNIIFFSNGVKTWKGQSVVASAQNVADAVNFVDSETAQGGTACIHHINSSLIALMKTASQKTAKDDIRGKKRNGGRVDH